MKKNRSSGFMLALLLAVITLVHAQQKAPESAEEMSKKTTEWMKTNLNLNDDQVEQVKDINLKYAKRNFDLKQSKQNKKQKLRTLDMNEDAKDEELKKVFTPEQYKTWVIKKEEMKIQLKERMKNS